jgi:hypothetical protein
MSRVEYMKEDAFCTDKSFDIIKSVEDENGLEFYRCTEATSGLKNKSINHSGFTLNKYDRRRRENADGSAEF